MRATGNDREIIWLTIATCCAGTFIVFVMSLLLWRMTNAGVVESLQVAFSCGALMAIFSSFASIAGMQLAASTDRKQYTKLKSEKKRRVK